MKDQISGSTRRRRNHEPAFKAELIAQSLVDGASVSAIAMKAGVNANLLFKWRREYLKGRNTPVAATLLPVCVVPDVVPTVQAAVPTATDTNRDSRAGVIEVDFAGARLRLRGAVDETMLSSVLRALRQSK